ncbi:uncharacterized protein EI90DRAFT_3083444 [Cantharellus anzutake]|uniref:uncharacterized protein n=1 Tax=Cantharellus anzutake TaxID=1750568 RepID=UPI0019055AEB|nr:uncharacterized protein EI90DRAFT_3083444 [Cantharellus anzutake]KAF8318560.1 hypothetical protein EI90DRAFT_3083444 [Cantharellus anzutake]
MPDHRTLGLSPEGRYVIVHDGKNLAIWSTETRELVQFHVSKSPLPVSYNKYPRPHLIIDAQTRIPLHLENGIPRVQSPMVGHDADLLWLERLSCELPSWLASPSPMSIRVSRPSINEDGTQMIWLNGKPELLLPPDFRPIILGNRDQINSQEVWYGDQMLWNEDRLYLPRASKEGARFLVQGHMRAPIVVDISQVV